MGHQLWTQDSFSQGELTPYLYARGSIARYYEGLKQAQNVVNYPTGAAGKRFGTLYQATLLQSNLLFNQIYFDVFMYLNQCIYQLVFTPLNIAIYLEGVLIANVTTTLDAESVYNLTATTLGSLFRVTGEGFAPFDLARFPSTPNVISAASANVLTLTTPQGVGSILPAQFTTTGAFPTSVPQIKAGITYFIKYLTTTTTMVYSSAYDAKFNLNPFIITNNGSGTNSLVPQNTWTFTNTVFTNLPFYDFNQNYDSIVFTPNATSGASVNVHASSPIFTAALAGGVFFGGGGTSRIIAVLEATDITVSVQTPFDAANVGIQGSLCLLAEPAWSVARGFPQVCSSYQNRSLFANTTSLPNGFWASVINDYANFGELTGDDDDAISWFPTSNAVNVINFIVPYRSITIHTNSGVYSSPLSDVVAITPSNFTLQLQDSTPAMVVAPQAIDNQIFILSGNDLHTMLWDGINNAYTSNIVSVTNEQTIRDPLDQSSFADLHRAGSRYIFIVNSSGSLAVYQTLLAESVAGMTPQIMEQSYGDAFFRQVASSFDGRCWFLNQREIANATSASLITAFSANSLTASLSTVDNVPVPVTFTTTGSLPASTPTLNTSEYFWGIFSGTTFMVYATQEDALAGNNPFTFTSSGTSSDVIAWPLEIIFTLEELTQDTYLDCAIYFDNASPISTIQTGNLFNAQDVKMVGDGFGFEATGFGNDVVFEAHGQLTPVSQGYIGFPINTIIEPMPIASPPGNQNTLTKPKHVRTARFMFNNTIGGTINGVPIALNKFDTIQPGEPPFPGRGFVELGIMNGWDDFNSPNVIIEHSDPFDIQLLGIFYDVDI
jgi:hypothetical protein